MGVQTDKGVLFVSLYIASLYGQRQGMYDIFTYLRELFSHCHETVKIYIMANLSAFQSLLSRLTPQLGVQTKLFGVGGRQGKAHCTIIAGESVLLLSVLYSKH